MNLIETVILPLKKKAEQNRLRSLQAQARKEALEAERGFTEEVRHLNRTQILGLYRALPGTHWNQSMEENARALFAVRSSGILWISNHLENEIAKGQVLRHRLHFNDDDEIDGITFVGGFETETPEGFFFMNKNLIVPRY